MKHLKRFLLSLGFAVVLSLSTFASDCDCITAEWFGSSGSDGSVLNLDTVISNGDIAEVLETYREEREAEFTAEVSPWSRRLTRTALIAQLEERIDSIILDASVTTFVTDVEETEDGYIASVYEWTFFDYDDLADGEGGSDTAGFGTEHKMTFQYDGNGQLMLVSDEYTESDVLTGEIPQETTETEDAPLTAASTPAYVADYDPVKAAVYANKWVFHGDLEGGKDPSYYNPEYTSYADRGGDCANYVSQCLYTAGMELTNLWRPDIYAWINCCGQHRVFAYMGKTVTLPTEEDVIPGCTIYYYNYTHVTICVGHNSAGTPVINGHTSDRYRVPWDYSKDNVYQLLQLTDYRLEEMTFQEDNLYSRNDLTMPVYSFYRDETAAARLTMKKGDSIPLLTTFKLEGTQWAAFDQDGEVCYAKVEGDLQLTSQGPDIRLSPGNSVTTNDYLTVTVGIPQDAVTEAVLTLGDSKGMAMTIENGKASMKLDCQNLSAGEVHLKVTVQGLKTGEWFGLRRLVVEEKNVVSGDGWILDKNTGNLTILADTKNAEWLRFADKVKTVEVSAEVTALPEGAFEGCRPNVIYGSQEFLESLAEAMGVEFVYDAFLDVSPKDWYFADVNAAAKAGAFQGMSATEFSGEGTMTRSMFVTVLARISGEDMSVYEKPPFADVEENTWYTDGLAWGYATGIVKGISETEFAPGADVTREQALTMIGRFISYYSISLEDAENPAGPFADGDKISDWAKTDVEAMRLKGIAQGTPEGEFQPTRSMKRAEAATFIMRLIRAIGEQELILPGAE